jgi:chemotaxis family two-component system response regulator Rcp1
MRLTPAHILLVEDNTFDAKVFRRAFSEAELKNPITVVRNGIEALMVLREYGGILDTNLVVVTDLNMPSMNGIDLLRAIRGDPRLAHLPVFVVTTSDAPSDRYETLELGIEGYICKTGEGRDVVEPIIAYLGR